MNRGRCLDCKHYIENEDLCKLFGVFTWEGIMGKICIDYRRKPYKPKPFQLF